jgi:hypothetical protein
MMRASHRHMFDTIRSNLGRNVFTKRFTLSGEEMKQVKKPARDLLSSLKLRKAGAGLAQVPAIPCGSEDQYRGRTR